MVNTKIILIIFFAAKDEEALYSQWKKKKAGSWLWLRLWTPFAKFRLKLKKIGETTRQSNDDLNQTPSDYTEEVRNRLKGLNLIDRVPEELWVEGHNIYRRKWSEAHLRKKRQKGCLKNSRSWWWTGKPGMLWFMGSQRVGHNWAT